MTTWNSREIPYPLLAPWTDDYGDKEFSASVPLAVLNNGKDINLTIKYHLTSQYLLGLVSAGKAQYLAVVSCPKTSVRFAYPSTQDEEILEELDAIEYSESIELRPYLVATENIDGFASDEHTAEFGHFKPEGFDIPAASILAVGDKTLVTLEDGDSPNSVIDLVSNPKIEDGRFEVDLTDHRIKVEVSPNDKNRIEAIRDRDKKITGVESVTLFPAIYLHAVTEALRNISEYPEARWVHTMRNSLDKHNINEDDEVLKDYALSYAQKLLDRPLGMLLKAFDREEV